MAEAGDTEQTQVCVVGEQLSSGVICDVLDINAQFNPASTSFGHKLEEPVGTVMSSSDISTHSDRPLGVTFLCPPQPCLLKGNRKVINACKTPNYTHWAVVRASLSCGQGRSMPLYVGDSGLCWRVQLGHCQTGASMLSVKCAQVKIT